jgi:uncharacterized protein (TIGR02145 family)
MNGADSSDANPSNVQGACPTSWHLPSEAEWTELETYLGGTEIAGGKLKETGTTHWTSPNTGATNEAGFTALPASSRWINGGFGILGNGSAWWSTSEYDTGSGGNAGCRSVQSIDGALHKGSNYAKVGYSVRCLKN